MSFSFSSRKPVFEISERFLTIALTDVNVTGNLFQLLDSADQLSVEIMG